MTKKILLLVAVSAVGLVVAIALMPSPTDDATISDADDGSARLPATANTGAPGMPEPPDAANGEAAAVTAEAHVDRLIESGFIPARYRALWLDPDYDRIVQERFNVIPQVTVPAGETCDPTLFDGGYVCWNKYDHHPYLAYDLDHLRAMADSDAAAAEALALRLPGDELHERLHYALLAAKLSGKSGPIMRFVYTFTPDTESPNYANQLLDRYAIALAGESMGYPYRFSRELERHILRDLKLTRDQLQAALRDRRITLLDVDGEES